MPHRLGPFDKELASATTLPAFAYTDLAILAAEQARIFRRCWEPIGNAVDVDAPGTFLTAEVAGGPLRSATVSSSRTSASAGLVHAALRR